jgi:hypothetical protein
LHAHVAEALAAPAIPAARAAAASVARHLRRPPTDPAPTAVLDALLHHRGQLASAIDTELDGGGFATIWTMTAIDPLLDAAVALEEDEGAPWSPLVRLLATPPETRAHSTLLRDPAVLEVWKMHLVAVAARHRLLAAIDADAPAMTGALTRRPHRDAVLARTNRHTARRVAEAGGAGAVRVRRDEVRVPVTADGIVAGHPMQELLAPDGAWAGAWDWARRGERAPVDTLRAWTEIRIENGGAALLLARANWIDGGWERWWARATRAQRAGRGPIPT